MSARTLRETCEKLGIPTSQAIVLGDGSNDLEMMAEAGVALVTQPWRGGIDIAAGGHHTRSSSSFVPNNPHGRIKSITSRHIPFPPQLPRLSHRFAHQDQSGQEW